MRLFPARDILQLSHFRSGFLPSLFPIPNVPPLTLRMDAVSPAPLLEEHLDLTQRLLLGLSASMTLEELHSLRQRLAHMHHVVGQEITLRTLDSEGVAPLGNRALRLSQPLKLTFSLSTEYLDLLQVDATPSNVEGFSGLGTSSTDTDGSGRSTPAPPRCRRRIVPPGRGRGGVRARAHRGRGGAHTRTHRGRGGTRVDRGRDSASSRLSSPQGST